jgi:hypothetical protein
MPTQNVFYHQVLRNTLIMKILLVLRYTLVCQSLIAQITMDPKVPAKFVMMRTLIKF